MLAHGFFRSRGHRDLAFLVLSFQQDKNAAETLDANGAGAYLGIGNCARVGTQAAGGFIIRERRKSRNRRGPTTQTGYTAAC